MESTAPVFEMGLMSWVAVGIASAIIFGIHGPKLLRDIRRWMSPQA
jgi:hypothetical protein